MGEKEYLFYLSADGTVRFRYYHSLEKGTITRFRIQFEALIEGKWYAIMRYDTAHGFPHRDLVHPDGSQDKVDFSGWDRNEVLSYGERDIKANWQRYRAEFEKELKK